MARKRKPTNPYAYTPPPVVFDLARKCLGEGKEFWILQKVMKNTAYHQNTFVTIWVLYAKHPQKKRVDVWQTEVWHHMTDVPEYFTGDWSWSQNYAHGEWEKLVRDGFTRYTEEGVAA